MSNIPIYEEEPSLDARILRIRGEILAMNERLTEVRLDMTTIQQRMIQFGTDINFERLILIIILLLKNQIDNDAM